MHARPPRTVLHFGGFELDPASGELRRAGEVVRLQPQPCKVLVYLASRPGRVIPRSELYGVLWPEGQHVDAERGLNFCIKELRKVLRDDARAPAFVETLPRRGYRFVHEVTASSVPPALVPVHPRTEESASAHRRLWWSHRGPALASVVLMTAILVGTTWWRLERAHPTSFVDSANTPETTEAQAPEAYLEGRYLASRGTEEDLERGLEAFRRAVEAQPDFAPAWTALAEIHLARSRMVAYDSQASLDLALSAAQRSVELQPTSAGYVALSKAMLYRDLDWTAASQAAYRGVELEPQNGPAHSHLAFLLAARGQHTEALAAADTARRLEPENPTIHLDMGWYHYLARNYDAAVEACQQALQLAPDFAPAVDCLESAHAAAGRLDLALAAASAEPSDLPVQDAWQHHRRAEVETLEASAQVSRCVAVPLAVELAELGETDAAFTWLETAWNGRSSWLPLVAVEPRFDPLRDDPRWSELMAKLGLDGIASPL